MLTSTHAPSVPTTGPRRGEARTKPFMSHWAALPLAGRIEDSPTIIVMRASGRKLAPVGLRTLTTVLALTLCGCQGSLFSRSGKTPGTPPPGDSWNAAPAAAAPPAEADDDVMSEVDRFIASLQQAKSATPQAGNATSLHDTDLAAPLGPRVVPDPGDGPDSTSLGTVANAALDARNDEESTVDGHADGQATRDNPQAALPVLVAISVSEDSVAPQPARLTGTGRANAPAEAVAPEEKLSVDEYLRALEQGGTEHDPVEAAWRSRLMNVALGRTNVDAARVDRLSVAQQDVLDASLEAVQAVRRVLRDPVASADAALEETQRLQRALAEMSDLAIPCAKLCSRVMTFGVYEPMASDRFFAGRVNQTILYCEVRNFVSKEEEGEHRSQFAGRVELLTPSGDVLWKVEEPLIEDRCSTQRTDFFIAQRISFPATIPAGDYTLKVMLEDKLGGKVNETLLNLTFRGAIPTASTREP